MSWARRILQNLYRDDSAQDLVEYALIAAFTVLLAIAGLDTLSAGVRNLYNTISTNVAAAMGS